jgi:hypothetical protein
LSGIVAASGALAIAGALLPWLTLYAGLYGYSGTIGLYGRLVLAAGFIAVVGGFADVRMRSRWLRSAGIGLGFALLVFSAWLYAGLLQIVKQPESAMMVARPGVGLYIVMFASALMMLASAAQLLQRGAEA